MNTSPPRRVSEAGILRSIVIWIAGIITMVFFASFAVLASVVDNTGDLSHRISSYWTTLLLKLARVKVKVRGAENIKKSSTYIIASNHQGLFDICLIATYIPLNFRWILKKELLTIPFFGKALKASQHIAVDREDGKKAMKDIKKAEEFLSNGVSIAIFPEGTRSRDGSVGEFKKGAFILANRSEKPILPVSIDGSYNILARGGFIVHPQKINFTIHKPIETANLTAKERKEMPFTIQKIIAETVEVEKCEHLKN